MTGASEEHHGGWLLKAQTAYSSKLQSQWTAAAASIKEVVMEAEEKLSRINEKQVQAMAIFTASKCNDLHDICFLTNAHKACLQKGSMI